MKKLTFIFITLVLSEIAFTQTASDVLRYSRIYYSGTARFVGTGGAFGALGADFSALAVNPAGIGLFQGSEFSMTIAPSVEGVRTDYLTMQNTTNVMNVGMGNMGFVFTFKPQAGTAGPFYNFNVAFGMNRQNDFNSSFFISGPNHNSSLLNVYTNKLNNTPGAIPSDYPFDIGPAFDASLIYWDPASKTYTSDQPHGGAYQSKEVRTYGSVNEFDISMGGNIGDKLYFGITFGVPFIRYYENSTYSEQNSGDTIPFLKSMYYDYHLETHGTGFVIKGGIIYRPVNAVRIGLAIHSPTWYASMHDHWYSTTSSYFKDSLQWNSVVNSPAGDYNYYMRTPFRAIGSLAFIIGQYGLVTAEYEYVNYSQGKLNSSGYGYTTVNDEIKSSFQSWGNIRVGTEWRIEDFRVRAGAGYYSNPYTTSGIDGVRYTISGGVGYRVKHFYADLTYQWAQSKEEYYLYNYAGMIPSTNTYTTSTVLTTIGFRF
ncbi:MAG: hypothetical protein NTU51_08660 [Bacteroidetes bacterium]|nr:hypothetical protein [Bacteroidota bacterium]